MTCIERCLDASVPDVTVLTKLEGGSNFRRRGHCSPPRPANLKPYGPGRVMIADDLADQMFGHLVPTHLAMYILGELVSTGEIQVDEVSGAEDSKAGLDSLDVLCALDDAYEDAKRYACLRPSGSREIETELVREGGKEKGGHSYVWRWKDFPVDPINEDNLAEFLNNIANQVFKFATPRLASGTEQNNPFVASRDKPHVVPLPYEVNGEDMRPAFLVLPNQAFSHNFMTVDDRHLNFTTLRALGESNSTNFESALAQVRRYVRSIRRAQPSVHFVTAIILTSWRVTLLRGEPTGTERLELSLSCGRGCIEFIRILLGLVLAKPDDLGQNPDTEPSKTLLSCRVSNPQPTAPCPATTLCIENTIKSSAKPTIRLSDQVPLHPASLSPRGPSHIHYSPQFTHVTPTVATSSTSKTNCHQVSHNEDAYPSKWPKLTHLGQIRLVPVRVYGYIFPSSSISGRSTTPSCVFHDDPSCLFALKMYRQHLECEEHNRGLQNNNSHPAVVVPVKTFNKVPGKGKMCASLEAMRGLRQEDLSAFSMESRVLTFSVSEPKRPVKYFWGVHDFVRGLRGALLGHEYLTKIGVLHRDISENSIALARRPGEERGYLIDFDMATLQDPQKTPIQVRLAEHISNDHDSWLKYITEGFRNAISPIDLDEPEPWKTSHTCKGMMPYTSFNVLRGGVYTYYDDIESFFYVLLLFFFSYAGPLSKEELLAADARGFMDPLGSGQLPHMRRWPGSYAYWADSGANSVAQWKDNTLNCNRVTHNYLITGRDTKRDKEENWPGEELRHVIKALLVPCREKFMESRSNGIGQQLSEHTRVSHGEFIGLLDGWLEQFVELEDQYSPCPF